MLEFNNLRTVNRGLPFGVPGELRRAGFRVGCGTQQRAGVVEDDAHWNRLEQGRKSSLIEERLHESAIGKELQNLRSDSSAKIQTTKCEQLERKVSSLCSVG